MATQITLSPHFFQPGTVRLDVMASALPGHFLGTAFDLVVPGNWRFQHADLCGIFSPDATDVFRLASPQPESQRVVFGLAVPGGKYPDIRDGCLVSFSFKVPSAGPADVSFEHTVLSFYQNGRRDLSDVRWQGTSLSVPQSIFQQTQASTQETAGPRSPSGVLAGKTDFFGSLDSSVVDVYVLILLTLVLSFAVFCIFLAYFRLRRKD